MRSAQIVWIVVTVSLGLTSFPHMAASDQESSPCQAEENAYDQSVKDVWKAQRELNWVNSAQNERAAAKFGTSSMSYRDWQDSVRKAQKRLDDAVARLNEAFKRLQECRAKHKCRWYCNPGVWWCPGQPEPKPRPYNPQTVGGQCR